MKRFYVTPIKIFTTVLVVALLVTQLDLPGDLSDWWPFTSTSIVEAAYITPTVRNVGTEAAGTTNITTNLPTYVAGDLLLLFVFWDRGDYAIPTITNWTKEVHYESNNNRFYTGLTVYSTVATSSIAAPVVTLNLTPDAQVRTVIMSIKDASQIDVINGYTSTGTGDTFIDAPSITPTQYNSLILNTVTHRQTAAITSPNTEYYNEAGTGAPRAAISGFTQSAIGATGAQSFTSSSLYRPTSISLSITGTNPPAGHFSGKLYSDYGQTPVTGTSYTIKAAVGTSTPSIYSTTTKSSDGSFQFSLPTTTAPTNWVLASSTDQSTWVGVAFGNGRFVAVSNDSASNKVMYSSNGASWTAVNPGISINPTDIIFANGRFEVIGGGTVNQMYSTDGVAWTAGTLGSTRNFLTYNEEAEMYVAMDTAGLYNYSHDGMTWTYGGDASSVTVSDIVNGEGRFVVTHAPTTQSSVRMVTSVDGINWSNDQYTSTGFDGIAYGNGTFVVVHGDGRADKIGYSTTGAANSWTTVTAPGGGALNYDTVDFVNGYFVAIAHEATSSTESIALSTDGVTWSEAVLPEVNAWKNITYGNGRAVTVASDGSSRVMYADMGIGPQTPITLWVDGAPGMKATTFVMGASNDGGVDKVNLYQDTMTTRNGTKTTFIGVTNLSQSTFYDSADDTDILYTTNVGSASTTLASGVDFYIATGTVRLPSRLVVNGNFINNDSLLSASSTLYLTATNGTTTGALTGTNKLHNLQIQGSYVMTGNASTSNLKINSGASLKAPSALTLNGSYTNSGTFTHNNGKVYFGGTSQQTATGTMTGTSAFNNLTLANTSGQGSSSQSLRIGAAITATGTFTMLASTSAAFPAGLTSSFKNITWQGLGTTTSPVYAYSTTPGSKWYLDVDTSATVVSAFIKDSDACAATGGQVVASSSVNVGNNTCWSFSSNGVHTTTMANHSSGQVGDAFTTGAKTNEPFFAFRLSSNAYPATTTNVSLALTGIDKVAAADFSNLRLYRDDDNDGQYDAGDTTLDGTGVMTVTGQSGTLVFDADFTFSSATNYLVVVDMSAPARGSSLTIALNRADLAVSDGAGSQVIEGSVSSIQHSRSNSGGGGGGDSPPAGGGVNTGGSAGGGSGVDTNAGGQTIGHEPNFLAPSANSGSWGGGANAYDDTDGTYATAATAVTHTYSSFSQSVPGGNSITGVVVKLEVSGTTAAGAIGVELSWDGGTSWTSSKSTPTLTTTDAVLNLGGAGDTWGHVWTASDFSNANFLVRLTASPSSNTVKIDAIQVRVYHQSSGGGGGGGGAI